MRYSRRQFECFIEGQKYSAKLKGVTKTDPADKDPCDPSWRINFGELLRALADSRTIHAAILVGSRPPKNDSVWEAAKQNGFEVTVYDRSGGKEKAVDTELSVRGTELIHTTAEPMVLIVASGDRDFIPLVKAAYRKNWEVEMAAFLSVFSPYGEMATTVSRVKPLDPLFPKIGRHDFEWPFPTS